MLQKSPQQTYLKKMVHESYIDHPTLVVSFTINLDTIGSHTLIGTVANYILSQWDELGENRPTKHLWIFSATPTQSLKQLQLWVENIQEFDAFIKEQNLDWKWEIR